MRERERERERLGVRRECEREKGIYTGSRTHEHSLQTHTDVAVSYI